MTSYLPTVNEAKACMDEMAKYIDRLYFTAQFHGKTCAMLAGAPGPTLWTAKNWVRDGVWVGSQYSGGTGTSRGAWLYDGEWHDRSGGPTGTAGSLSYEARQDIYDLKVCPHDPDIVMVTSADGVWRSPLAGLSGTWSKITMPYACEWRSIAFDTENPGLVLISGDEMGSEGSSDPVAAYSTDYGESFTAIDLPIETSLFLHDPGAVSLHDGRALICCIGITHVSDNIWRGSWNGTSWTWTYEDMGDWNGNDRAAARLGHQGHFLQHGFVSGGSDEYWTENGGDTWTQSENTGPGLVNGNWKGEQLIYDFTRDGWWQVIDQHVKYKPQDGSWITKKDWGSGHDCKSICVDQRTGYVYITKNGGAYVSYDGGDNWVKLGDKDVYGFGIDSAYADYNQGRMPFRCLGQYCHDTLKPWSVVPGQSGRPSWVPSDPGFAAGQDSFVLGIDQECGEVWKGPPGKLIRDYGDAESTDWIKYTIEDISPDAEYDIEDRVDVYLGNTCVVEDLLSQSKSNWHGDVTKTATAQNFLRSLDYPPRHSFELGQIVMLARKEQTKAGYFQNSIDECDYPHPLYHVFYGHMDDGYDDYYQWDAVTYGDFLWDMKGDQTMCVPMGIADDGAFFFPHESKTRAAISTAMTWLTGQRIAIYKVFLMITRDTTYVRMQWATHLLKKYGDLYKQYPDPRLGTNWVNNLLSVKKSIVDIADEAIDHWNRMDTVPDTGKGVGYPNASSDNFWGRVSPPFNFDIGCGFTTPQFAIFMTLIGYGCGLTKYQQYADDAIEALRRAQWGVSPINNDSKGYCESEGAGSAEFTRPDSKGGVMTVYKAYDKGGGNYTMSHAPKGFIDKMVDKVVYDLKAPDWLPETLRRGADDWDNINQVPTEAVMIPTTIEATTLSFIAFRIWLAYKHNEAYPADSWDYGLDMVKSRVFGKVKDSGGTPIEGAAVYLVKNQQSGLPQTLTKYIASGWTNAQGDWSFKLEETGVHTVFVVCQGKYASKFYDFPSLNRNYRFPDVVI